MECAVVGSHPQNHNHNHNHNPDPDPDTNLDPNPNPNMPVQEGGRLQCSHTTVAAQSQKEWLPTSPYRMYRNEQSQVVGSNKTTLNVE